VGRNDLINGIEWLWTILYYLGAMLVGLVLPEKGMRSKTTSWTWQPAHFYGFYKRYQ
tara:strand:+ start:608 stop:778 length:171 start_codon:yes stop_codon:yes gene_type:complete